MLINNCVQLLIIIITVGNFCWCSPQYHEIVFPNGTTYEFSVGNPCITVYGTEGSCKYANNCPEMSSRNEAEWICPSLNEVSFNCCPNAPVGVNLPSINVSAPYLHYKPGPVRYGQACGSITDLTVHSGWVNGEYARIYELNKTLDKLHGEGFQISNVNLWGDAVYNFTYSNGTFSESIGFDSLGAVLGSGGQSALKQRAFYMALIGAESNEGVNWVCDGVVITRFWVLSAATCFAEHIEPNIVRLGDYNWRSEDTTNEFYGEFVPIDFTIEKVVRYPEFKKDERYHDLILIKLNKGFPMFALNICPVCLPWDDEVNIKHIEDQLVLSGWGQTAPSGGKTSILQEVNLTVFETSYCDEEYSLLSDYNVKWPQGMTSDKILCAGSLEEGMDQCVADSGAPVVYQTDAFTLAGIVSGGYGCQAPGIPGIYIPINNPHYLTWIKTIAFADHDEASSFNFRGEKIN